MRVPLRGFPGAHMNPSAAGVSSRSRLRRLLSGRLDAPLARMLRPFLPALGLAAALQAVAGLAALVPWIALAQIAGRWEEGAGSAADVAGWVAAAAAAGFVWLLGQTCALYLTHRADAGLGTQVRRRLAGHLGRLPLGWFARAGGDDVARHADRDVRALHQLVAHAPADFSRLLAVPLAAAACLAWVDPLLLAFALLPLLAAALGFRRLRSAAYRPLYAQRDAALERLSENYAQLAQAPVLARMYPGAGIEAAARASARGFERAFAVWAGRVGRVGAAVETLLGAPVLAAWVALGALAAGPDSAARLCLFVLLVRAVAAPVQAMGHGADALREALAAARRLEALLALPVMAEGRGVSRPADGSLRLEGVALRLGPQAGVRDIDLHVPAGTAAAIVGPSGAGKTTLLMLAARFMDPDRGTVRLGGVDARDLPDAVLRAQVAMALQRADALDLPLEENISLFRPAATREEIREAARLACLDARIMALPHGYGSVPGRDVVLSGGELQRLALARALLSEAPLLLLDEPSSALDPLTERALRGALHRPGRTRVIVTHDLAGIRHVEQILVLRDGAIVERGTHGGLLAAGGQYAGMWAARQGAPAAGRDARAWAAG